MLNYYSAINSYCLCNGAHESEVYATLQYCTVIAPFMQHKCFVYLAETAIQESLMCAGHPLM